MNTVNLTKQTINLSKGEKINLSKHVEGLSKVRVALGWKPAHKSFWQMLFGGSEAEIDCDAWIALRQKQNCVHRDTDLVWYRHLEFMNDKQERAIIHHGDNLVGSNTGDAEVIEIKLDAIPARYDELIIGVTIYQGTVRGQSFGSIFNTYVRIVDARDNFELCRFTQKDMAEMPEATTYIAGRLYKVNGEWEFEAVGKGALYDSIGSAVSSLQNRGV